MRGASCSLSHGRVESLCSEACCAAPPCFDACCAGPPVNDEVCCAAPPCSEACYVSHQRCFNGTQALVLQWDGVGGGGYHVGLDCTTVPRGSSGMPRGVSRTGSRAVCAALAPSVSWADAPPRNSSRSSTLCTSCSRRMADTSARGRHCRTGSPGSSSCWG